MVKPLVRRVPNMPFRPVQAGQLVGDSAITELQDYYGARLCFAALDGVQA